VTIPPNKPRDLAYGPRLAMVGSQVHSFGFLRSEQSRDKETSGVSLPLMRHLLQASLIRMAGRCPWCLTRFDDFLT